MKDFHNLTINLLDGELKHYRFNSSYDFLIKSSAKGQESQFALSRLPVSLHDLQHFLGNEVQLDDIFVDTVDFEQNCYWLMVENSQPNNLKKLYTALLKRFSISEELFLKWAGYLNERVLPNLDTCIALKCIAALRVPLKNNRLKIYARPFRHNQFTIKKEIENTLLKELDCTPEGLNTVLYDLGGVSYDFSDGRIVLFTQNDSVKQNR